MTTQSMPALQQDASASLTLHRPPLPALTGIRFFAAMQVVMFHFGAGFAQRHGVPGPLVNFLANGWTAVTLFFILSGFILSYTYAGQINKRGGKKRFWEARFARIYPVYLLSLALNWPFRANPGPGLMVAVLTMVQAWNPFHIEYASGWNMPAWTLSTEAFFYLFFPFLLPLLEKCSDRVLKVLAVATVLVITLGHTMTHAIEPLTRVTFLPLPAFRFPEFFAGMLSGLIFLRAQAPRAPDFRAKARKPRALRLYTALFSIAAILVFAKGSWLSLLAIPFTVLIYELAVGGSWISDLIGSKAFVLLGGASYAIYLLQEPVRSWMHRILTGSNDLNNSKGGIDALLSPVILVLISIVVYLFWEEPARKWLRSWFKRHTESRSVAV